MQSGRVVDLAINVGQSNLSGGLKTIGVQYYLTVLSPDKCSGLIFEEQTEEKEDDAEKYALIEIEYEFLKPEQIK